MLEVNAADFYRVTTAIQHTVTAIEIQRQKSIQEHKDGSLTFEFIQDKVFIEAMIERCEQLTSSLNVLGARITIMAAYEMDQALRGNHVTYEGIAAGFRDIQRTLNRELTGVTLLYLNKTEREWFAPQTPLFGLEFAIKFPTEGAFELDEAAKCLALGRPTACVFHLMRLMEIGIKSMRLSLQIPDPVKPTDRNWGAMLSKIWNGIEAKWPSAAARNCSDGAIFEDLHASLDAVKHPWRNATMHVEKKYTDDEAQHIFLAVKGFMNKLASRMDEAGSPKV